MTLEAAGSHADVQRLCRLAGLPRATYYRHLAGRGGEAGECELRDLIQRICLKHRFYGYRRVTAALRRQGMVVNAKKVQRLMREDNLLAQRKAPFLKPPADRPSTFLIVPNLVRGLMPSAPDQIWVADITYVHLAKTFAYLAVIIDALASERSRVKAAPCRRVKVLICSRIGTKGSDSTFTSRPSRRV
jgi:transposase InsO family protein